MSRTVALPYVIVLGVYVYLGYKTVRKIKVLLEEKERTSSPKRGRKAH